MGEEKRASRPEEEHYKPSDWTEALSPEDKRLLGEAEARWPAEASTLRAEFGLAADMARLVLESCSARELSRTRKSLGITRRCVGFSQEILHLHMFLTTCACQAALGDRHNAARRVLDSFHRLVYENRRLLPKRAARALEQDAAQGWALIRERYGRYRRALEADLAGRAGVLPCARLGDELLFSLCRVRPNALLDARAAARFGGGPPSPGPAGGDRDLRVLSRLTQRRSPQHMFLKVCTWLAAAYPESRKAIDPLVRQHGVCR